MCEILVAGNGKDQPSLERKTLILNTDGNVVDRESSSQSAELDDKS